MNSMGNAEGKKEIDDTLSRARWIRPDSVSERAASRIPDTETRSAQNRPAQKADAATEEESEDRAAVVGDQSLENLLMGETRERITRLASLERQIEEKLRSRWRAAEDEIRERRAELDRDLAIRAGEARINAAEALEAARKDGRAEGFREGFEKGAEEGRRLGFEQGRIDGTCEGRLVGRREEQEEFRSGVEPVFEALARAARKLENSRERMLQEAREGVVDLSVQIAQKIIDRELQLNPRTVLGPAGKAVEQIFRGCDVILQVHPDDACVIDEALRENSRWAEELTSVKVQSSSEVERGGCRLISGSGVVDMTLSSQLELIEEALKGANLDLEGDAEIPASTPDSSGQSSDDGGTFA